MAPLRPRYRSVLSLSTWSIACVALLAANAAAGPIPISDGSWTLAILPDTQYYVQKYPNIFTAQTQFLADNRQSLNLGHVLHEGDITNNNTRDQWANASASMRVLDNAGIDYSIIPGNHDLGPNGKSANRSSYMSEYFPVSRLAAQPTFGGVYPGVNGSELNSPHNSYSLFSAGGNEWLVVSVEFGPRDEVVQWADSILKAHPDRQAMVLTHAYTFSDSTRYDWAAKGNSQNGNPHAYGVANLPGGVNDGEEMWQELKDNANLKFVFNGHVTNDGSGYLASTGDQGNTVHQLLANYQHLSNGGEGYMRLLEFMPDDNTVHVRTYSPWLDAKGLNPYRFEPDQDFVISLGSGTVPPQPTPSGLGHAVAGNLVVSGAAFPKNVAAPIQVARAGTPGVSVLQSNRGDYQIAVDGRSITRSDGILLASVTENVRDGARATVEVDAESFGKKNLTLSVTQAGNPGVKEANFNTAVAWFDFNSGWKGAHLNAKGGIVVGNDIQQNMITRSKAGRYVVDLGVDSRADGLLFAVGANNANMIVNTGVLADGNGWDVRVQTNAANFAAAGKDAPFSFLYLPMDTENLVGGRYDGLTDQNLVAAGDFDFDRLGIGQYRLTIDGETPESGMLILTTAALEKSGSTTAPDDNFLSYQSDGSGNFIINSADLTGSSKAGTAGRGANFQDTAFSWAFVSFTDPLAPPGSASALFASAMGGTEPAPFNMVAVPEPGTLTLAALALLLAGWRLFVRPRA